MAELFGRPLRCMANTQVEIALKRPLLLLVLFSPFGIAQCQQSLTHNPI